jgi:ATP-dependent Zn protease
MPLLLDIKDNHEKPIIMIIEDGDICLVPRKNDNISSITSLLNLSDGILGTIMDIKMIISTNADIEEMDQAILRPGRLCKNIHVGSLEYEQANRVYRRLMQKEDVSLEFRKRYTLAEIYDKFNNIDLENASKSQVKQVIGFGMPLQESPDRTLNSAKKIGF